MEKLVPKRVHVLPFQGTDSVPAMGPVKQGQAGTSHLIISIVYFKSQVEIVAYVEDSNDAMAQGSHFPATGRSTSLFY